jgi:hypothetical protein
MDETTTKTWMNGNMIEYRRNNLVGLVGVLIGTVFGFSAPAVAQWGVEGPVPEGFGHVNIRDFGAVGDGKTDDTAAFQKALALGKHDRMRMIYIPDGVYLLRDTLKWSRRRALIGQSREGVVLKLADNADGFADAKSPRPLLHAAVPGDYYGNDSQANAAFANYIQNLTVHTGTGNPGAIAVRWTTHNYGMIENVLIRSGDGRGVTGLDMTQTEFGPGMVMGLTVEGFDTGIATPAQVSNAVFDTLTLRRQREVGIDNQHPTAIHRLRSDNRVPAVRHRGGHLVLINAELSGGADDRVAIEAEGEYYLRDVRVEGYRAALRHGGRLRPGRHIDEFVSGETHTLGETPAASLRLPVKSPPPIHVEPIGDWRVVEPGEGAETAMLQAAMNSGAGTVFLKGGTYEVGDTIRVPATVGRILFAEGANLRGDRGTFGIGGLTEPSVEGYGGGKPFLRLEGRTDRSLAIERARVGVWPHRAYQIEIATPRPVLIRHGVGGHPGGEIRTAGGADGGSLFLVETSSDLRVAGDYEVYIRQYNPENNPFRVQHMDTMMRRTYIVNDGARVWVLGYKTESPAIHAVTRDGGRTEVLGGFFRDHFGPSAGIGGRDLGGRQVPYFIVENAATSAMYQQFAWAAGAARALQMVAREKGREEKIELSPESLTVPLIRADTRPAGP